MSGKGIQGLRAVCRAKGQGRVHRVWGAYRVWLQHRGGGGLGAGHSEATPTALSGVGLEGTQASEGGHPGQVP